MMSFLDRLLNHNHKAPAVHLTVRPNPKKQKGENSQESKVKEISQLISRYLMSLTLTDNSGFEADQLDIVLDDSQGDLALPARGAILALGLGWKGEALTYKGEYTVEEVEHSGSPDILTIRARSADLHGGLMEQKERSFHRKTLGDIVKQIALENKLKPMIGKEFEHLVIPHIDQTNESAMNLLQRLAEMHDAIATVKNGNLLFIKAGSGKSASGQILPTLYISRQLGDSHRFSIAEGDNYKAVKAYWHDTRTGKRGVVIWDEHTSVQKVRKPTLRKKTKVKKGKDGKKIKGADGKSIKETVYVQGKGRMVNQLSHSQPVESDSDNIKTLRHTYASEHSAITACKRTFEKLQRGVATLSLNIAIGNAELIPELPVVVQGFKAEIDSNEWIIRRVTHNLSPDSGFTTSIECELKVKEEA